MKNIHRWGFVLHSYRNCPLDVWRFSPTRQYLICHRSGRLGDRMGYTLDFKLITMGGRIRTRASFRSGEIRILDSTGKLERTIAFSESDRML
jgi:hypothetical protein